MIGLVNKHELMANNTALKTCGAHPPTRHDLNNVKQHNQVKNNVIFE